jgi:hypothetical protein
LLFGQSNKNDQNFELEKTMKFRGRSSIAADDKVVSTAVAKKQWFLKDLSGLPSLKAGWKCQILTFSYLSFYANKITAWLFHVSWFP